MKKLVFILAVGLTILLLDSTSNKVYAQQDAQYSMYMFNMLAVNPAYAGSRERWAITALYRHQWAGFGDGVPRTAAANAHGPLLNDRIGLGISIANDRIGPTSLIEATAHYAYRLPLGTKKYAGKLCFGLNARVSNYAQRWSELTTADQADQAFVTGNESIWQPNFGAGLYYYNDRFYAGFSVPNMLNTSLDDNFNLEGTDLVARKYRHTFITLGAIIPLTDNVKLKPSMLFKQVKNSPFQGDFNASLLFKEALWIGASFRTAFQKPGPTAVIGMVEYMFAKHLRVGYAYDYTLTQIGAYQSGTHEILVGYEFGSNDKYLTPRRMSYF